MRDILSDLEDGLFLSDPDPVRRAQLQMRTPLPKRFYQGVSVAETEGGHAILLDGKQARTPARAALALPTAAAAALVAAEFEAQADVIDPVKMPVLRLTNTVIDGVAKEPDAVLEDILRFASSDLLCYRADSPDGLVERQNALWDPIIDWTREALGARLVLAEGVMHVEQPRPAIAAIGHHLAGRSDPYMLAALHLITSITGSALLALAVEAGRLDAEQAWEAAHVDEDWQIAHWGEDAEAMARRAMRKRDYLAAVRIIEAVRR
jgi:chaperone required for assembly of F1-ATPase